MPRSIGNEKFKRPSNIMANISVDKNNIIINAISIKAGQVKILA